LGGRRGLDFWVFFVACFWFSLSGWRMGVCVLVRFWWVCGFVLGLGGVWGVFGRRVWGLAPPAINLDTRSNSRINSQ